MIPNTFPCSSAARSRPLRPALDGRSVDAVRQLVEDVLATPIAPWPTEVALHLDQSAESWRDEVVAVARDRIASTELQKTVLARLLTLTANSDFPLASIVTSLAERFAEAMVFSIDGFVGASPELLVSRDGRTVRAHPLAGTAARSGDPDIDAQQIASLHASAKDRVEHQITIDWLLTELLPFCSYVDAEPEPSTIGIVMAGPPAGLTRRATASSRCRFVPLRSMETRQRLPPVLGSSRKAIRGPNSLRPRLSFGRCSGRFSPASRSVLSRRATLRGHCLIATPR